MPYAIYQLDDPRNDTTHYVGMSKDPHRRYAMHLLNLSRSNTPKDQWIQELRKEGLAPLLVIIEPGIMTIQEARDREAYWIRLYRKEGRPLTNRTEPYEVAPRKQTASNFAPMPADEQVSYDWSLDQRARDIATSMNGRLIGRWQGIGIGYAAYVFSKVPGKRHKMISMEMLLSQFIRLPEDEIRERIRCGITESEGMHHG